MNHESHQLEKHMDLLKRSIAKEISHNTLQELDRRHLSYTRKMMILSIFASLGMAFGFAGLIALISTLFFQ